MCVLRFCVGVKRTGQSVPQCVLEYMGLYDAKSLILVKGEQPSLGRFCISTEQI
jgi:hypothetical protein